MFQPISGGGHVIPCILGVVSQHCVSVVGMLVHVCPQTLSAQVLSGVQKFCKKSTSTNK